MNTGCGKPAVRPLVDTGAMVFVVFGIRGVNRTRGLDNHVIGDMVQTCRRAGRACWGLMSEGKDSLPGWGSVNPRSPGSMVQLSRQMELQRWWHCDEPKVDFCFNKFTNKGD